MNDEIKSMHDNKIKEIVPLPKSMKVISYKWIFKIKWDTKGNME
jgi:hypothetical protein